MEEARGAGGHVARANTVAGQNAPHIDQVRDRKMAVVGHREQCDLAAVRQPLDRIEQAANFGVGADDRVTRLLRIDPVGMNDFVRLGEVSQDEARAPIVGHPQVLDNIVGPLALARILRERPRHFAFLRHVSGEDAAVSSIARTIPAPRFFTPWRSAT